MPSLRIVLVDDHAVVRDGLKALISVEPDMQVVGVASDGREAIEQVSRSNPHMVVMDISMPGMGGQAATRELLRINPSLKVLVLSVHETTSFVRELIEAGAAGYILKRSSGATLIDAIRTVAVGQIYLDPVLAGRVVGDLLRPKPDLGLSNESELSKREAEVIHLIVAGYSNREVAEQLGLSTKTVETYKARAMVKLGLSSRAALVSYALSRGWLRET